jgi:hypothetical protein
MCVERFVAERAIVDAVSALDLAAHAFHRTVIGVLVSWTMVAKRKDTEEVVGVALTLADCNQVLAKLNERPLPLGWITALPVKEDRRGSRVPADRPSRCASL